MAISDRTVQAVRRGIRRIVGSLRRHNEASGGLLQRRRVSSSHGASGKLPQQSRQWAGLCLATLLILVSIGTTTATASPRGASSRPVVRVDPVVCSRLRTLGAALPFIRPLLDAVALTLGCRPPTLPSTTTSSTTTTTTTPPQPGTDRDNDSLTDDLEGRVGTDPARSDTDGDGLADTFEVLEGGPPHSPFKADTDGDGISDANEDIDQDGLTALQEQTAGTSPITADSDGDGLTDGQEVLTYQTDPLSADTDNDDLSDEAEVSGGTDPLTAETRTTTTADGGTTVALTGDASLAEHFRFVDLARVPAFTGATGQVGSPIGLELSPDFTDRLQTATVTMSYTDAQVIGDEADLRLFTFDEQAQMWVPAAEDQTVDPVTNTVTAQVPHFSVFSLFNIKQWDGVLTSVGATCRAAGSDPTPLDLALVLDSSGSMSSNDPQGLRRTESKNLVDALLVGDQASVVDFDDSGRLAQALTSDKDALKSAIDTIDASGGTDIAAGVRIGIDSLGPQGDRARVMVLLTDGDGSYTSDLTAEAQAKFITIYTVGLGSSVNETLLRDIATATGGEYFPVASAGQLADAFDQIHHNNEDDGTDTDGDGLSDCLERNGAVGGFGFGKRYTSDPNLADTDGDGLTDATEVGPRLTVAFLGRTFTFNVIFSDPRLADTDGDGLSDADEKTRGTNPWIADTDGDGASDGAEVRAGTDPKQKAFDRMMQRLTDFATEAKCTAAANGCSNDDFVRKSTDRLAGFDPGRFVRGLPVINEGPNRVPPPEEIFRTSGWKTNIVDSDGHPDDDSRRSPARHFVGSMAMGYFHPRVANTALSCNEQAGNPGASEQDVRSGRIAIDLGIKLRRGDLTVQEVLRKIPDQAGDPTNRGQAHIDDEPSTASVPFWVPC